jgi:four helix bundle protein
MAIRKFEDIVAWQKARDLTHRIYCVCDKGRFARDFRLCSQIQAATVSIMSNIGEGFERKGPGEFHQFLGYAKGSCAEVRSDLYVALDLGYIDAELFADLYGLANEIARMLEALRSRVAARKSRSRASP